MSIGKPTTILMCAGALLASTVPALAEMDVAACKSSIMGALAGEKPMPPPMPMPDLKPGEPMPTGMAKDATPKGDVGPKAAMQDKCMDDTLKADQDAMDKKK